MGFLENFQKNRNCFGLAVQSGKAAIFKKTQESGNVFGFAGFGKKGQISSEYSIVLAIMFAMLVLVVIIFGSIYSQQATYAQQVQANSVISTLAYGAKNVWAQGAGAQATYFIDIPEATLLSNSSISGGTIRLYVRGFGDAFTTVGFNLSGWWPQSAGSHVMHVSSNGTHVIIRPDNGIWANKRGFYFDAGIGDTLIVKNDANESYDLARTYAHNTCTGFDVSSPASVTLASGVSQSWEITPRSLAANQECTGYVQISATPASLSSNLTSETMIFPITTSWN